jgi:hypothetical protein
MKALEAWTKILRDKYGVVPRFVHSDKDMAEIGMSQRVWPDAKVQLCWWHIRKAVRSRLQGNLPTSPYNIERAHREYAFIKKDFLPYGRSNLDDTDLLFDQTREQSVQTNATVQGPNSLFIRIPNLPLSSATTVPPVDTSPSPSVPPVVLPDSLDESLVRLTIKIPARSQIPAEEECENEDVEKKARHTFCPDELRSQVVEMMERHLCAHPLIPGYSAPVPEGIKEWAVMQTYQFCEAHDLPNLWTYLWENWYRSGRWELWARCVVPEIPRLKTTMMVEAQ